MPSWKTDIEPTISWPWMFEMSKHSIRSGRLSRLSASRSSSSACTRRSCFCSETSCVRVEREPRVLAGELGQPPLLAARGHAHVYARAAQLREELLQRVGLAASGGTTICGGIGALP